MKMLEVSIGGVKRKPLTCRKGLTKRGICLMFYMRALILTIVLTLEPLISLQKGINKRNINRVNNRFLPEISDMEKTKKISRLKKR